MLTAADPRVQAFWQFVQSKPRNGDGHYLGSSQNDTGLLYVIGGPEPMIQVWLPRDLLEYANAAAGSSGDRPVGIRVKGFSTVDRAADEVVKIFLSPENLAQFIRGSAADYHEYRAQQQSKRIKAEIIMANDPDRGFWAKYGQEEMRALRGRCSDQAQLKRDFQTMTLAEFEDRYMLTEAEIG